MVGFLNILIFFAISMGSQLALAASVRVASWNAKHLGRDSQDLAASAVLLQDSDVVAVQEVNTSKSGLLGLRKLAEEVGKKAGATYCLAVSDVPTGSKERYGFIWREDRLSYVTTSGKTIDGCPKFDITTPVVSASADGVVREPAYVTLKDRRDGAKITIVSVHLVPTAKKPETEVAPLFSGVATIQGKWCRLVVGDFNLASDHPSFSAATGDGYTAAFGGEVKTSLKSKGSGFSKAYDNIFHKNCSGVTGQAVGNPGILGMSQQDVYKKVSDHMPVSASVTP